MLEDFAHELDEYLVYSILQPHGFFEECINYALIKNNHEMVVTHYITSEDYLAAIDKLKKMPDQNKALSLIV